MPVKPKWATRVGVKLGRIRKPAWERFLEEAYWNVELERLTEIAGGIARVFICSD